MTTSFLLLTLVEWLGVGATTFILGLSPAFRRRPVKFVYPRRETIVSLSLFLLTTTLVFAFDLFVYPQGNAPRVPAPYPVEPIPLNYPAERLIQQLGLLLIISAPYVVALVIRRQPWLSAGLSRASMRAGLSMGLALAFLTIFLTNHTSTVFGGLTGSSVNYLLAMLAVGLVEETIFRGYTMLRLMDYLGETWGWILQAVLYALWHLPQKLVIEHASPTLLAFSLVYLFLFGLLLGWIMRKCGNVLGPGLYHAIHNWVLVL
ncbi:MAG TPA: CPBP family intramembrane glutamic endopeptidase [Anaerolineaceae bacterium]|nr:CPBP family intramembrane glutamic endopeptidase [Anaerolineaceae bacterium]